MRKFNFLIMRSPTKVTACFDITPIAGVVSSLIGAYAQNQAVEKQNESNLKLANLNNYWQDKWSKENNELAVKMMREQNQFNRDSALEMFNLENEYNSPANQAKRMLEAGFNPGVALSNGAVNQGNSNASAPTATGVPSLSMPNFVTPTLQAQPSVLLGAVQGIAELANARKLFSESKMTEKQNSRYNELVDKQMENLDSNIANTEADTALKSFNLELDQMFARAERKRGLDEKIMTIKKIGAEFSLAVQQGESEKARKLLMDAERVYTNTQNDSLKLNAPIIHDNLIKTGQKILAEKSAALASANASNASAKLSNEQAETVKSRRADIVRLDKELADEKILSNEFSRDSFSKRLTEITKRLNLTESQTKYFEQQIQRAKKENNIFYIREAVNILRSISDGVSQYIPTPGFNGTGSSLQVPSSSSSTAPEWSFLYGN